MRTAYKKFKRWFVFNSCKRFFVDQEYDLILKYISRPYSMKRESEVLLNIFRIIALKETNQAGWIAEFDYLIDEKLLTIFNKDTHNYVNLFLDQKLFSTFKDLD